MSRKYIDERLIVIIPCLLPLLVLSNCLCAVCNMRLFGLFHTLLLCHIAELLEWILGMWADCANVASPVSLGQFECENISKQVCLTLG